MRRQFGQLFFMAASLFILFGFYPTINGLEGNDNFGNRKANQNLSKLGYKPVPDTYLYVEDGEKLNDNFLYKEWCEETFDNGKHIYEAYKNIAFNIEYTPEPYKTDLWQTPIETSRLKKGDCEDIVFHFFSQLHQNQKNAEIVWGWVIGNQDMIGRAHVWYQLIDKRGQQYVVEGFSKDWDGIIPMGIVENTETRWPIFTIFHSTISRLANSPLETDNGEIYRSLPQFVNTLYYHSDHELIEYQLSVQDKFRKYPARHNMFPNTRNEISNILKKLHEVFSRYKRQSEGLESDMWIPYENVVEDTGRKDNLICRR